MRKFGYKLIIALVTLAIPASVVAAEKPPADKKAAAKTQSSDDKKAADSSAKPAAKPEAAKPAPPKFEYGFEHRIRGEFFNNLGEFNDAKTDSQSTSHRVRFRTKVWTKYAPSKDVDVYMRLTNEFRKTTNDGSGKADPSVKFSTTSPDEVFFDNLYVDMKKLPVKGFSAKIGRQDIVRGDGFILSEGTPLDGSRSSYFNAFVLGYGYKKTKLELIGTTQPRNDRHMPHFNDREKPLSEYNEEAIGGYLSNKSLKNTDLDAYAFLKKESRDLRTGKAVFTPDRHVYTLGGRFNRKLPEEVTVNGEFAYQRGTQSRNKLTGAGAERIRGWGGYGTVRKDFAKVALKPYLAAGYVAMSGDDYKTAGTVEGWDPVFSRWPSSGAVRSELVYYNFQKEKGLGYWSNIRLPQLTVGFQPIKQVKTFVTYMYADAFHPWLDNPGLTSAQKANFGPGLHRGDVISTRTDIQLSESWKGHIQYETMNSGDFYSHRDRGYFFRTELIYTFKGSLGGPLAKK